MPIQDVQLDLLKKIISDEIHLPIHSVSMSGSHWPSGLHLTDELDTFLNPGLHSKSHDSPKYGGQLRRCSLENEDGQTWTVERI